MKAEEAKNIHEREKASERERLRRDIFRPDIEKFRLFTQMLRRNMMIKKAIIKHKL